MEITVSTLEDNFKDLNTKVDNIIRRVEKLESVSHPSMQYPYGSVPWQMPQMPYCPPSPSKPVGASDVDDSLCTCSPDNCLPSSEINADDLSSLKLTLNKYKNTTIILRLDN